MTALELRRKTEHKCTRCGVELSEDDETNLCEPHRRDLVARVTASQAKARARRRATEPGAPIAATSVLEHRQPTRRSLLTIST